MNPWSCTGDRKAKTTTKIMAGRYSQGLTMPGGWMALQHQDQAWAGSNLLFSDGRKPIASVETARLDSIIKEPKIRIMKMDIEGAELEALKGGIATLKKTDYIRLVCCDNPAKEGYRTPHPPPSS